MAESKIMGEEGAAATIIGLLTSISVVVYSFVHVCCCQTTLASKGFLVFSSFSVAWYVCAIGAFDGSEDSWIEAQCSQKVYCHHVDTGSNCELGAKICHEPTTTETTLGGMANITLPGFSTTAGITEVMTITVAYSTRKKSA